MGVLTYIKDALKMSLSSEMSSVVTGNNPSFSLSHELIKVKLPRCLHELTNLHKLMHPVISHSKGNVFKLLLI